MTLDQLQQKHAELFENPIIAVRSPGRANIIGEHTDYNDGFVLPFAIDKGIFFAASRSTNGYSSIYSTNMDRLEENIGARTTGFLTFFQSAIDVLELRTKAHFNISFGGNLPIGAGVSSSSAITCGFIAVCNFLYDLNLSKDDIVRKASESEHGAGLEGGMMDQFAIMHGEEKKVLCLDCLDSSWFDLEIDTGQYEFVLINTHVEHSLTDTAYNKRVTECKDGLNLIKGRDLSVQSFRDLNLAHIPYLPFPINNRIQHVIEENDRVKKTVEAIRENDMATVGRLLLASHESLRDLYCVSCPELDFIVEKIQSKKEILGARMMGGGFGGCVICLAEKDSVSPIVSSWNDEYRQKFNLTASSFSIVPKSGLQYISIDS